MYNNDDPIIAISTAHGYAGIGIIRISFGNSNKHVIESFIKSITKKKDLIPRRIYYASFYDKNNSIIDNGIIIYFLSPFSYTGEDILELQGHGSPIVLKMLLKRCLNIGKPFKARLAEPGEFTQRAFLNNKLDLTQAESICDLIKSKTEKAAKLASKSLNGEFSKIINNIVNDIISLRVLVEMELDFPEEIEEFMFNDSIKEKIHSLRKKVINILKNAKYGRMLSNGLTIVIAGQPNVGKSSLLNVLANIDLAIVTSIPGTTRDKVTYSLDFHGIPIDIIDTAGLRSTKNIIENIGIKKTWEEINKADIILHLIDARNGITKNDKNIYKKFPINIPIIRIFNKIDLINKNSSIIKIKKDNLSEIFLSVLSGDGINILKKELLNIIKFDTEEESIYIVRERHLIALRAALNHIDIAKEYINSNINYQNFDLLAEELHIAQNELNKITGQFTSNDLLNVIFKEFCIGK